MCEQMYISGVVGVASCPGPFRDRYSEEIRGNGPIDTDQVLVNKQIRWSPGGHQDIFQERHAHQCKTLKAFIALACRVVGPVGLEPTTKGL